MHCLQSLKDTLAPLLPHLNDFPMHSRTHILTIHLGEPTGKMGENDDSVRYKAILLRADDE